MSSPVVKDNVLGSHGATPSIQSSLSVTRLPVHWMCPCKRKYLICWNRYRRISISPTSSSRTTFLLLSTLRMKWRWCTSVESLSVEQQKRFLILLSILIRAHSSPLYRKWMNRRVLKRFDWRVMCLRQSIVRQAVIFIHAVQKWCPYVKTNIRVQPILRRRIHANAICTKTLNRYDNTLSILALMIDSFVLNLIWTNAVGN